MAAVEPAGQPAGTPAAASVTRGSMARFVAEALGALLGLITGSITARNLGPAGKGTLSSLGYLVALFGPVCAVGLGEAGVTMIGQRRADLQRAVSASLGLLALALPCGMLTFLVVAASQFGFRWEALHVSIIVACLALPPGALVLVFAALVESRQRVVFTSVVRITSSLVTAGATAIFVLGLSRAILGALFAIATGAMASTLLLTVALVRMGIRLRPTWDPDYVRTALRLGWPIQVAYVLSILAQRVDLLLVNALSGSRDAGHYSVARTLGELVVYAPFALSVGSYPRLAHTGPVDAIKLVARLVRISLAAAIVSACALAIAVPIITPLVFGPNFRPAVGPALVLLIGGVFWSGQWVVCRAWAAQGNTGLLARSYGASLVVMVALDYALIAPFGTYGAAVASVAGSAVGSGLAVATYIRAAGVTASSLLPRPRDFRELLHLKSLLLNRTIASP